MGPRGILSVLIVTLLFHVAGHAQSFPSRPVRMVVPYPPGGGADINARLLAQGLLQKWGQTVVVDNRGGATGMIGGSLVANSSPDGYTVLLSSSSEVALNVVLFEKMPYDPIKAFEPLTLVSTTPMILVTHPSMGTRTVKDFVAHVAARRGQLNYASGGTGTPQHFAGELLKMKAKIDLTHVPYKSGGLQIVALLGGQVPCGFPALLPAIPHIKSGRLIGLAVSSTNRSPSLLDIPTVHESGYPGFDIVQWYGMWAPAGTPKGITSKVAKDLVGIIKSADFQRRMIEQGAEAIGGTPEELGKFQLSEIKKYRDIADHAGIKGE